jgi:hypothetical protein
MLTISKILADTLRMSGGRTPVEGKVDYREGKPESSGLWKSGLWKKARRVRRVYA